METIQGKAILAPFIENNSDEYSFAKVFDSGTQAQEIHLCYIHIHIGLFLVSLQVILFDEALYALLDAAYVGYEMLLDRLDRLGLELLVHELLARLHDAHDGRVEVVLAVAFDGRLRARRFFDLRERSVSPRSTKGA